MTEAAYDLRKQREIEIYAEVADIHALPEIFHHWSNNYNLPAIVEVFNVRTVAEFYAMAVRESAPSGRARILSIGCGYGDMEFDVARTLIASGYTDFELVCADISPPLIERLTASIPEDLRSHITPVVCDLNAVDLPGPFTCMMANHSLHHIEGLEHLFDYVRDKLTEDGILATSDVIGRNGHMRWPEAEAFLQMLWRLMPQHQRVNRLMSRIEHEYINHDCSTESFEGIRAQDILPLILQRLHPKRFLGYGGGLIDLLIDRAFGHNFDARNPDDVAFIDMVATLNDLLVDADVLKPTLMFGHFSKRDLGEICFRGRSAARSVRDVTAEPPWAVAALAGARLPPTPLT